MPYYPAEFDDIFRTINKHMGELGDYSSILRESALSSLGESIFDVTRVDSIGSLMSQLLDQSSLQEYLTIPHQLGELQLAQINTDEFRYSVDVVGDFGTANNNTPSLENVLNARRLSDLDGLTDKLVALIYEEEFEYGIENRIDILIKEQMRKNAIAAKSWLNDVYMSRYSDPNIVLGVLRAVSRLDYDDIYPQGPTMAVAAFSHRDLEIREAGVRAFEAWASPESLSVLQAISLTPRWLQDYVDEVTDDLRRIYDVSAGQNDHEVQVVSV